MKSQQKQSISEQFLQRIRKQSPYFKRKSFFNHISPSAVNILREKFQPL